MLTLVRRIKRFESIFHSFSQNAMTKSNETESTVYKYYINGKSFTTI